MKESKMRIVNSISGKKGIAFSILSFAFFSLLLIGSNQKEVHAATASVPSLIADTPCDTLYYESLAARAWLEAQREITQNQNIILKPDSVFEYTCFDRLVWELANHANEMLSETVNYSVALNSNSMDTALNDLVGSTLTSYINGSFGSKTTGSGYSMLAGHTSGLGIFNTMQPVNSGPAYSCDIMGRVWQAAKCTNFITNSASDGFYTFAEYATDVLDKRHLPTSCSPITGNWAGNLISALTSGPWTNDPVQTYVDYTEPQNCSSSGTCSCDGDPVPTGLRVQSTGVSATAAAYDEHVCLQPGCFYYPGAAAGNFPNGSGTPSAGCYAR